MTKKSLRWLIEKILYKKEEEKKLAEISSKILHEIDRSGKWIKNRILIFTIVTLSSTMLYFIHFTYYNRINNDTTILTISQTILIFTPAYVLIFMYFITTKIPWRNYLFLRWFILFNFKQENTYSINYIILLVMRAFFSFLLCLATLFSMYILLIQTGNSKNEFYFKSFGLLIVCFTGVFITLYAVILLPLLIKFKTHASSYKYLFWLFFIKSRLNLNGFLVYFALPLFALLNIAIIITPYTYTTKSVNHYQNCCNYNNLNETTKTIVLKGEITKRFSPEDFLELGHFSLILTIIGLWISSITLIFSDIFKNYDQISKGFSEYSSLILQEKLLRIRKTNALVISYNSISKIPLGHLLAKSLSSIRSFKKPLKQFELIIDKSLTPRLIPREIAVIEKRTEKFDDVFEDKENGLKFGIISCHDIILKRKGVNSIYDPTLALFALVDDGTSVQSLKSFSLENLSYIINTSNDPHSGLRLAQILKSIKITNKPNLITTVNDTTSFSILENISTLPIFPIYPGMQEGWSLGSRLFHLFSQNHKEKRNSVVNLTDLASNEKANNGYAKIVFLGRGKDLFYTVNSFLLLCKIFSNRLGFNNDIEKLQLFVDKHLLLLTDEETIISAIQFSGKEQKEKSARFINIGANKYINIRTIEIDPTRTSRISKLINDLNFNCKVQKHIFVLASPKAFDELRMLQIIKQSISQIGLGRVNIISNIHEENLEMYRILTKATEGVEEKFEEDIFFPRTFSQLVKTKYSILGNQISSLCDYLDQADIDLYNKDNYSVVKGRKEITKTGEISLCANNKPGVFLKTLCKLSGFENLKPFTHELKIPEFYYANSFSVKDVDIDIKQTFLFFGDCTLGTYQNHNLLNDLISGSSVNGTETFEKEFKSFFKDYTLSSSTINDCGFNQKCPVCSNRIIKVQNVSSNEEHKGSDNTINFLSINEPFAKIILWGEKDDVSGALALAMADLLLLGSDIQFCEMVDSTQVLNIMQTSLLPCMFNNQYTIRLYGSHKTAAENNFKESRIELKSLRNILGIKIKLNGKVTDEWNNYFTNLRNYIDNTSAYTYDSIPTNNEWTIFRREIYDKPNMKSFFDNL